ncbi:MAG: hypothetical protein A3H97_25050 [Acidobacteria bacterium RIFCSPLOWO2_02_FULL_65_29]|nr:MAG: hypothetical protein A3H97_25050 [Acidobacteria bacterium RIFCSPLOWO2_02_FULL_65_29]
MRVAFGLRAHSGWAALVVVGERHADYIVVDRRRIELVEEVWAKQPYHAAQRLEPEPARHLVSRGIEAARRLALQELRTAVKRERARKNEVAACAVLVANVMPDWSVEEILAVHFRMHKAEGALFRDALAFAANACGLRLVAIPEKLLAMRVEATRSTGVTRRVPKNATALEKPVGPPWGKDQKDAGLAAVLALQED